MHIFLHFVINYNLVFKLVICFHLDTFFAIDFVESKNFSHTFATKTTGKFSQVANFQVRLKISFKIFQLLRTKDLSNYSKNNTGSGKRS